MALSLKKKRKSSSQIGRLGLECLFLKYDHDINEGHVTYAIQIKCQANESTWNICKRYKDFYRLNTELQKDKNFRGIKLPDLPGKAIAFTDASKQELTEERMHYLEIYLNGLISRTIFLSSPSVRAFLCMPDAVRDLAIILTTRQNAALKQGYMHTKYGLFEKWRKMFFVLQPNYILKYYKKESSREPEGSIDLSSVFQIRMKNLADKRFSFSLILTGTQKTQWVLACNNETEKREWTRMLVKLRQSNESLVKKSFVQENKNPSESLEFSGHFKTVTQMKWNPAIPGVLATGSNDNSVIIWKTHLLDDTLIPPEYDNTKIDKLLKRDDEKKDTSVSADEKDTSFIYPLHTIEFQQIVQYKTSGLVTWLEWSPDGSMVAVALSKGFENKYYVQCLDLNSILSDSTHLNDDTESNDGSQAKIFTLQDRPSRLAFSNDGSIIYMSMDIDPDSEENHERRPAFLVYVDLTKNTMHRCQEVDGIIDHQTEFIIDLVMNNARTVMVVATSTHQDNGRLIAWNIEKMETHVVDRTTCSVSALLFTEDDKWLIVGMRNGRLEFWKLCDNGSISMFKKTYQEKVHHGPIFHLTASNGVLISSAKPTNLEYESFFTDSSLWDIRLLINSGKKARLMAKLNNINEFHKDITRWLDLSPVTPSHVRDGGSGTLLAASGDHNIYCHNMVDILFNAWGTEEESMIWKSKYQSQGVDTAKIMEQNADEIKRLQTDLECSRARFDETREANLRQRNTILNLQNELDKEKSSSQSLVDKIKKSQMQNNILMDDKKELELKNQRLITENFELKMNNIDVSKYQGWKWENILQWILTIEDSRFVKYEKDLRHVLSQEQPLGEDLHDVNEGDIKRWGVTVFKDIKILYKNIKRLTADKGNNVKIPIAYKEGNESGGHYR